MSATNKLTTTGRIKMLTENGPFQGRPALTVMSINKNYYYRNYAPNGNCDIIRETHTGVNDNRPSIDGTQIALELPREKYGSIMFTKPNLIVKSVG